MSALRSALDVPASHRGYVWGSFAALPALMNGAINPAVAAFQTRGLDAVPAWGRELSVAADSLGTGFFLPVMTCLIVTPLVRRAVRRGRVAGLATAGGEAGASLLRRALGLGAGGLALFGGSCLALLALTGIDALPREPFLVWKAASTFALGALVTPWIALRALEDPPSG